VVVVIEGSPGIGKSRLLTEAMRMADRRAVRVGLGEADKAEGIVELAPLLRALFDGRRRYSSAPRYQPHAAVPSSATGWCRIWSRCWRTRRRWRRWWCAWTSNRRTAAPWPRCARSRPGLDGSERSFRQRDAGSRGGPVEDLPQRPLRDRRAAVPPGEQLVRTVLDAGGSLGVEVGVSLDDHRPDLAGGRAGIRS
jgi:hypothetical protein